MEDHHPLHRALLRALGLSLGATLGCCVLQLALLTLLFREPLEWIGRAQFWTSFGGTPGDPSLALVVVPLVFAPWCLLTIASGELARHRQRSFMVSPPAKG